MNRRSFMLSSVALVTSHAVAQEKVQLRLSTAVGPAFALGKAGERWAALLNEGAAGGFEVVQYPGAILTLRDSLREFGALRDGAVDLAVGSALAWSAQLPVFGVYGLPWLAPEQREQEALARAPAVQARVQEAAAAAGVAVVAIAPLGERAIATFDGGLTEPSMLAGRTIRTVTIPIVVDTLATLGADAPPELVIKELSEDAAAAYDQMLGEPPESIVNLEQTYRDTIAKVRTRELKHRNAELIRLMATARGPAEENALLAELAANRRQAAALQSRAP